MREADFIQDLLNSQLEGVRHFPNKLAAETFVTDSFRFLFIRNGQNAGYEKTAVEYKRLRTNFLLLLSEATGEEKEKERQTEIFFNQLPRLYRLLLNDAKAILDFDPAAHSMAEVVVAYPGFFATVVYRLAHQLWKQGMVLLARLFSEYAHSKTGIDIHPAAQIGSAFAIDHGTGIVVGETAFIGNNVKLYQGVTLGALHVDKSLSRSKRHPTIEDEVVIYSGATILGGQTTVGNGSIIGGNVWLTYSVPPNSVVYHKSEVKIKDKDPFPEPLNFII